MSKYAGNIVTTGADAGNSVFFDGTGDYLTLASNAALAPGSGDFTIEAWLYPTAALSTYNSVYETSVTNSLYFGKVTGGYGVRSAGVADLISSPAPAINQWVHVAASRSGTSLRLFINGVLSATVTDSTNFVAGVVSIGAGSAGANPFPGYISNLRFVKGTALYTASFTPPTQLLNVTNTQLLTCNSPAIVDQSSNNFTITINGDAKVSTFTPFAGYQGFNPALGAAANGIWNMEEAEYYQSNRLWPIYDPQFNRTALLLHGNGTNGAQNNTFLDSSTNNFAITRNGNTTQGTFSPFSQNGWSSYFTGTTSGITASNAALAIGTSSFTIEAWINVASLASANLIGSSRVASGSSTIYWNFAVDTNGQLVMQTRNSGGTQFFARSEVGAITVGQWYHVATTRSSTGLLTVYVNGVAGPTTANDSSTDLTEASIAVGLFNFPANLSWFSGYISNFRVVKGAVLYSGNFTPPSAPLTVSSTGTTLMLTCQSNRFVDNGNANGGVGFTLSPGTSSNIQAFSPFVPTYTTPITYSNYFDGTGDFLTVAYPINWSTYGSYTLEFWFYTSTIAANNFGFVSTGSTGFTNFYMYGSSGTYPGAIAVGIQGTNEIKSANSIIAANTWYHIAYTYDGTTTRIFVNGALVASGATAVYSNNSANLVIGNGLTNNYTLGDISNLRLIQGTALYTSAFTPPTAPFPTNTTNQQLLTCQSSTLIDANTATTAKTITSNGNVQVVSSPNPFGFNVDQTSMRGAYSASLVGGSGYFDGTGDSIAFPTSQASLLPGAGAFTYELWCYQTVSTSNATLFSYGNATGNLRFFVANSTSVTLWNGSTNLVNQTTTNPLNGWQHFIVQRDASNVVSIYQNGVRIYNNTVASTFNAGTLTLGNDAGGTAWNGYISGFKATIGSALYSGTGIAIPTAPPSPTGSTACVQFTNGGIIDSTGKNVLETVGNAQISTAQSKWGGSSMAFDGTVDALFEPSNTNYGYGTGDFTIEFWLNLNATTQQTIVSNLTTNTSTAPHIYYKSATGIIYYTGVSGTGADRITGSALSTGVWYHIAVCRASGSTRLFINGVQSGSTYTDANNYGTSNPLGVADYGAPLSGTQTLNGYIDDLRITKGYARYTGNFTPPTSQLQDQ